MKKVIVLLLALLQLAALVGCSLGGTDFEPVHFYYLRDADAYLYGAEDGVVTYEERDPTGHEGDFRYLLMLYLQGPLDDALESPFPAGCALVELSQTASEMHVTLNSDFATLRGMDRTLACVCLARTCFSLANVRTVHILARSSEEKDNVYETITIDSLLLEDNAISSGRSE